MRWDALDLKAGVWRKAPSSVKQNRHHEVQLSAPVRQLLSRQEAGDTVFPGRDIKHHWEKIIAAAGIEDLRIHDLRHSLCEPAS